MFDSPRTLRAGGVAAIDLLEYSVISVQPEIVFGYLVTEFQTRPDAQRALALYDIFCAPCHDEAGTGNGMVVQRGYQRAASLHVDRLRESPPGYFYDVITAGAALTLRF